MFYWSEAKQCFHWSSGWSKNSLTSTENRREGYHIPLHNHQPSHSYSVYSKHKKHVFWGHSLCHSTRDNLKANPLGSPTEFYFKTWLPVTKIAHLFSKDCGTPSKTSLSFFLKTCFLSRDCVNISRVGTCILINTHSISTQSVYQYI